MLTLGDLEEINYRITNSKLKVIKVLHIIAFGVEGQYRNTRKPLRTFSGFRFNKDSEEYYRKLEEMAKLEFADLIAVSIMLGLDYYGTKQSVMNRIYYFLNNLEVEEMEDEDEEYDDDEEEEEEDDDREEDNDDKDKIEYVDKDEAAISTDDARSNEDTRDVSKIVNAHSISEAKETNVESLALEYRKECDNIIMEIATENSKHEDMDIDEKHFKNIEHRDVKELIEKEAVVLLSDNREELRAGNKQQILRVQEVNRKWYSLKRRKARQRTLFGTRLKVVQRKYLGPEIVKVKDNESCEHDGVKISTHEGSLRTSTRAEFMKPWITDQSESESDS